MTVPRAGARFRAIVERPCFYCGKESGNGHFNGLDRTDSGLRVYSVGSVVSCCGTCNIMKYRWSVEEFLGHCVRVAAFAPAALLDLAPAPQDEAEVPESVIALAGPIQVSRYSQADFGCSYIGCYILAGNSILSWKID